MFSKCVVIFLILLTGFVAAPAAIAATWYVDGVNGNDKNDYRSLQTACKTIGHAISLASSGDSIKVAAAVYNESLVISTSLKLIGTGAPTTIIDGGAKATVVTTDKDGSNVTLSKMTIRNGSAQYGGGIYNIGATMTINNCAINGNLAGQGTNPQGGGIENAGTMTINDSTISNNKAGRYRAGGTGGGIANAAYLTINNSTIIRNSAVAGRNGALGGGLYNHPFALLTVSNSTISRNNGSGGGINNGNGKANTAVLQNSIVAENSGGNCGGMPLTSNGLT